MTDQHPLNVGVGEDSTVLTAPNQDGDTFESTHVAGSNRGLKRGVRAIRVLSRKSQLTSIFWGITYSAMALLLTLGITALAISPVIVTDGGTITGKSFAETILWSWLVLNGVAPQLGAAAFTLIPWGLVIIPWLVLMSSGKALGHRIANGGASNGESWPARITGSVLIVVLYTTFGTVVAASTATVEVSFDVIRTLAVFALMSVSAVAIGMMRSLRVHPFRLLPPLAQEILTRGAAALLSLIGVAALLVAAQLAGNFSEVLKLANGLNPGFSGFLAIVLLSLGYLPVLVVWAMSYMLGAGFVIGPEAVISPFIPSTAPTQLPPLPILAALPSHSTGVSWLLPVITVGIGALLGIGIARRKVPEPVLIRIVIALAAAFVAAICVFVLTFISSGNLGDVRLVGIGPDAALAATLAWILLVLGAAPISALPRRFFERKRPAIRVVSPEDQGSQTSDSSQFIEDSIVHDYDETR